MSADDKKKVVADFFQAFADADGARAAALLDDSAQWRVMGREGGLPMSGEMDKDGIADLMGVVKTTLTGTDGMTLTPKAWTVEGDRVALEMESYGEKAEGTVYNNHYHFLVLVLDGKITELREYGDTYHVWRVFIDDA